MAILTSDHNTVIECSNGYAVSLAYGKGSYSTNRDGKAPQTRTGALECQTVEIAILDMNKTGEDHYVKLKCDRGDGGGIHGWCSADQVARVIGAVVDGDLEKANMALNHNGQ